MHMIVFLLFFSITIAYKMGKTDGIKGTGVFSSFELKREKTEGKKGGGREDTATTRTKGGGSDEGVS